MHPRSVLFASSLALTTVLAVPAARAQKSRSCTPTGDQVTVTAAAPDGKSLERAPYLYVVDGVVDITFAMPSCGRISTDGALVLDGVVLAPPTGAVDPSPTWAQLTSDQVGADGLRRMVVRVGFAHDGQGAPHVLDVIAGGLTHHVTLVDVADVDGPVRFTMSTAEIKNRIMLGIAQAFPDGTMDKTAVVIREPDWSTYLVDIDPSGVRIRFHTTASPEVAGSPYWCDVGVDVDAAFAIQQDSAGRLFDVPRWTNVAIHNTGACTLVEAQSGLVRAAFTVIAATAADQVEGQLDRQISDSVGGSACGLACIALNLYVATTADGIEVLGDAFGGDHTVTVHVPYGGSGLADPTRWTPLPPGAIAVLAGGTVGTCVDGWNTDPATCAKIATGPGGLYDAWGNFPGIDPDILYWGTTNGLGDLVNWAQVGQREAGVTPMPEENIGALVARLDSSAGSFARRVDFPCQLPTAGTAAHLGFAINDAPRPGGDAYGRGSFDAMIVFLPDSGLPIPACHAERLHLDEPIRSRWAMIGSELSLLGMPTTTVQVVVAGSDTAGRFADFEGGSLYFHPRIGLSHLVIGAIRAKWLAMGGAPSWYGFPTTDELDAPGDGKLSRFENGTVYFLGAIGAHMVQGGIRERYEASGGPGGVLGYPITDEGGATAGRANHFEHGSIFWTGWTGAHVVRGAIRDAWANLGWERSALGFPTAEQGDAGSGWTSQQFEHGTLYVHPQYGTFTIPS